MNRAGGRRGNRDGENEIASADYVLLAMASGWAREARSPIAESASRERAFGVEQWREPRWAVAESAIGYVENRDWQSRKARLAMWITAPGGRGKRDWGCGKPRFD